MNMTNGYKVETSGYQRREGRGKTETRGKRHRFTIYKINYKDILCSRDVM